MSRISQMAREAVYSENPEKLRLGGGTFHSAFGIGGTIACFVGFFLDLGFTIINLFLQTGIMGFRAGAAYRPVHLIAWIAGFAGLFVIAAVLRTGKAVKYEATGREFTIMNKNGVLDTIFYKDVLSVSVEDLFLLKMIPNGYILTVHTKKGIRELNYVFPGMGRRIAFDDCPLAIIKNICDELRKKELAEGNPSSGDPFVDAVRASAQNGLAADSVDDFFNSVVVTPPPSDN